jgi:hypothetical protein
MCSLEHMPFIFQIQPVSIERGFTLSCEGILDEPVLYTRFIDAVIHAAQLGRELDGEIHIFSPAGRVAEVLPLPHHHPSSASFSQPQPQHQPNLHPACV